VIVEIDPHDDAALQAWHDVYLAAERHERPFAVPWMFEEVRAQVRAPAVAAELVSLALLEDGDVVATGGLRLPLMDNLEIASLLVHTHPRHRRRGHATALLAHLERLAVDRGRRVLTATTDHGYDLGPTGAGDPGVELLRRHGFDHALGDVQQTLDLPVDEGRLAALAEVPAPYRVVTVTGPLPDELLPSYCRLAGTLVVEAPTGDLEQEAEVFDEERVRVEERQLRESGRTRFRTLALGQDGDVVAFTELDVPRHDPGRAYQQGTLVAPEHRGHGLGAAVKAANLLLLQEREPGLPKVITYNAEVNEHMVRVNALLGFRPTARLAEMQKRLT
jgi:GNAT superfamily N-acetyltransferase